MPIAAILRVRMAASTYRGAYRARMSRFRGKIWDEAVAARGDHPRRVTREGATASYLRQLVEVVSTPPSTTRSSGVAASP